MQFLVKPHDYAIVFEFGKNNLMRVKPPHIYYTTHDKLSGDFRKFEILLPGFHHILARSKIKLTIFTLLFLTHSLQIEFSFVNPIWTLEIYIFKILKN